MPELKTLDQQRAAFAWDKVSALGGSKDYRSLVRQLPSMVQTNGLAQTLAFLLAPSGAKKDLYQQLQQWLCTEAPHPVYPKEEGKEISLMRSLTRGDSLTLRRATLEVQALALWLKRFSEALDIEAAAAQTSETSPEGV
jgi:CRISPR-associated protein Cmr5